MKRAELTPDQRADVRTDTIAALVGAALFVGLGETRISWPTRRGWNVADRRVLHALLGAGVGVALLRSGEVFGWWDAYREPWLKVYWS